MGLSDLNEGLIPWITGCIPLKTLELMAKIVQDKDLRALFQALKPVLGEIAPQRRMGGRRCCNPRQHREPPICFFRRRKYPTKNKCSEMVEIIGKLGEIFISFGMREMGVLWGGEGVDRKKRRGVIYGGKGGYRYLIVALAKECAGREELFAVGGRGHTFQTRAPSGFIPRLRQKHG